MNKDELTLLWKKKIQIVTYKHLKYDIDKVQEWFRNTLLPHAPAWQGAYDYDNLTAPRIAIDESDGILFGGWSLLGPNENYWSGWFPNGDLPVLGTNTRINFRNATIRTDLCTGIMNDIIDDIESNGLKLSRARVTVLKPGDILDWHSDTNKTDELLIRIQFPIIATNDVIFKSKSEKWIMPSDGTLFIVNTNHMHQVENRSNEVRFNLIADIDLNQLPNDDFYQIYKPIETNDAI